MIVQNRSCVLIEERQKEKVQAKCRLWIQGTPSSEEGDLIATIGDFYAEDRGSAHIVLEKALSIAKESDFKSVVGPMNQTTWNSYRFITNSSEEPRFFLEDENPAEYVEWFREAGFYPIADYCSLKTSLDYQLDRCERLKKKFENQNIKFRMMDLGHPKQELDLLYELSTRCFRENYLYTDIAKEEFFRKYKKVMSYINPQMVRFAYDQDIPIGFFFMIPNVLDSSGKTVIAKTIGVLPEYRKRGIAYFMLYDTYRYAADCGYEDVIIAYIYSKNNSRRLIDENAKCIREYQLLERRLS